MALIACPDCPTLVSDRAPTCPKCGAPIAGRGEAVASGAALTTIQETSKRLKVRYLWLRFAFGWASFGSLPAPVSPIRRCPLAFRDYCASPDSFGTSSPDSVFGGITSSVKT